MSTIESQEAILSRHSSAQHDQENVRRASQVSFAGPTAQPSPRLISALNERTETLRSTAQVNYNPLSQANSRKPSQATIYSNRPTSQVYYNPSILSNHARTLTQISVAPSSKSVAVENRIAHDLIELLKNNGASPKSIARSLSHLSQSNSISATLLSEIEAAILRSSEPVEIHESDEIEVLGQRGIWANKAEVLNWKGIIPISEYTINEDANPEVITKRSQQILEYLQEIAIRYLRPPTPPAPGEIVITQEQNILTPPAPPLIIRQQPARPETPEPLVIREAPPNPPSPVGRKIITISGKRLPPPPRKVIIERFAELPAKPQSVLIERWLPYAEVKRRVLFQPAPPDPVIVKPRNIIVQWEAPEVHIRKELKYLGIVKANPAEYVHTYGQALRASRDLPEFVYDIKNPDGLILAADYKAPDLHELEGDLHALKLVNLDAEGLGGYRQYLTRLGVLEEAAYQFIQASGPNESRRSSYARHQTASNELESQLDTNAASVSAAASNALGEIIENIFRTIDRNNNGIINVEDAEKTLLRLNSRLGRRYGEDDVRAFFNALDVNNDGTLDLNEFKRAFLNIAS